MLIFHDYYNNESTQESKLLVKWSFNLSASKQKVADKPKSYPRPRKKLDIFSQQDILSDSFQPDLDTLTNQIIN